MLRAKISLVYAVLIALTIGLVVAVVHFSVGDLVRKQTAATLQQGIVGAEQSAHLEEASLLARAEFVARNDRLYRSLKGEFVGEKGASEGEAGEETAQQEAADFEGQRHLDAHEKLTAQNYHLNEIGEAEKDRRAEERSLLARAPKDLDIFMVLDNKGKGVAALGKDLYSWFGSDVGASFKEVGEVAKGGNARIAYWMWSFKPGEEKRLHRVALAPLRRTADEAPSGVVVLGSQINDGLAARKQALFEGGAKSDGTGAVHLAFYYGDSIVGSTFESSEDKTIAAALAPAGLLGADPTEGTEVLVGEVPYLAISRPLTQSDKPVGVTVVANLNEAQAPVKSLRFDIIFIGLAFLLLGVVLMVVLIHRYLKPVEDLEDGVQEVIAGNKDYVWAQKSGHDLQSSLAQQLNLMSAFLQGKPMPDDESTGASWGDLMPGGGDTEPQGPGQVSGVDLQGLMGARKNDDDGAEG